MELDKKYIIENAKIELQAQCALNKIKITSNEEHQRQGVFVCSNGYEWFAMIHRDNSAHINSREFQTSFIIEKLQEMDEKDFLIKSLLERVERLEKSLNDTNALLAYESGRSGWIDDFQYYEEL